MIERRGAVALANIRAVAGTAELAGNRAHSKANNFWPRETPFVDVKVASAMTTAGIVPCRSSFGLVACACNPWCYSPCPGHERNSRKV